MSTSTPLRSFLGGLLIPLSMHALLLLNGDVFGVSGFLHRAARGQKEAAMAVVGLTIGGMVVGAIEGIGPEISAPDLRSVVLAGLLVGVGSRMSNGCTSGHMIAGLSRFSPRSLVATATFFLTGVLTTRFWHSNTFSPSNLTDWNVGRNGSLLLAMQALPFAILIPIYYLNPTNTVSSQDESKPDPPRPVLRILAAATTAFSFALALRLSNLTESSSVATFLLTPFDRAFNPSLAFLAVGALPLATLLYHFARGSEIPRLGGKYSIPRSGKIDTKLVIGAALFGVGWGISGICPAPGLVNLGRAIASGSSPIEAATWLVSVVAGGLIVR